MVFNRIEAKFRAKASIRQAQPGAMRVAMVFLLLTSILSSVVNYLAVDVNPVEVFTDMVFFYGYRLEEVLTYIWKNYTDQVYIYLAVSAALGIYSSVMNFGYASYSLRLSRNEDPELSHIFDGFLKLLRVLWMNFLKLLFTLLWMSPAIAAITVMYVSGMELEAYFEAYALVAFLAIVVWTVPACRYCLAEYFLLDDPSRTARQCIRESKKAMKGWKMERFTLDMSFVGWQVCGRIMVISLSSMWYPAGLMGALVFNAWYLPYYYVTAANFYNAVTKRTDPFQQGPNWEERMKELQDSFDKPEF